MQYSPYSPEYYQNLRRRHSVRLFLTYVVPLIVLTIYFFVQHASIVEEGQLLQLTAIAEGQTNALDLFLFEREEDLSNVVYDALFEVPPTQDALELRLDELRRDSEAFVDLGFIDESSVQVVYAGPFASLQKRNYGSEPWYLELRQSQLNRLITDVYLGFRGKPHITIAVKRSYGGETVVLKASLEPTEIYEHISSWGEARDIQTSIVNSDGLIQVVAPGAGAPLEPSPVVPPESPRVGTGRADVGAVPLSYAYSWLTNVDWALIVHQQLGAKPGLFSGSGFRMLGTAGVLGLIGLFAVSIGARRLTELQKETDRVRAQASERAKELACLYGISRLVEKPGILLEEILQGTVDLIPDAWQYPEITCARIVLGGKDYATAGWKESVWKQTADITVNEEKVGTVEVCYTEERRPRKEGPFVDEERHLLDAIASRLGRILSRKRAEESQVLLATAVEQAAESITVTDVDGNIQYVNPAFVRISGYTREEIIGKNPRILKSGKHDRVFYESLWKTILSGRTWEGRFVNKAKDGSRYDVDCRISPVKDEKGNIVHFVAVKHDVTDLVKLEESLRQAQKMEAIGQLAGGVAHDFNNILTVILTSTHYLLKAIDESSPLRQDVEEIKESGERAAALTRQLLAFSRRQVIEPRVLDLNEILGGTEKMLRRLIGEDIVLETETAADLGLVYVDPAQVEQVILNLAVNARDAMPDGGKLIIGTESTYLDEDYARLHTDVQPGWYVMMSVSDTGCGMDGLTVSRIFEPFFTTKDQGKGTGLGLSTVYGIVKQAGGHIWVYSEMGKGTVFKMYLPRVDPEGRAELLKGEGVDSLQGSETVLVVEDDDSVRRTAVRILRDHQYTVLEAHDGKEALNICKRHGGVIDLLLTDLVMPEMSGKKLAEVVRALRPEVKVLFMSGYANEGRGDSDLSGAGYGFVQKPLIPNELARKVRVELDGL